MSRPHGILKLAHLPHRDISVGFDPIMAINVSSWTAFKTDVVTKTDAKRGLLETLNNAEGEVSDGYIKNANGQVINVATNAVIERFITNNDGSYQLTTSIDSLPDIIKILVEPGGTDISTNTTHTSELTAIVIKSDLTSSNKVSINPITSMVVSIAEENSTVDATAITNAKTDVKQAFGITDAQLNKDYIKENDNTLAVITAQLETLASTLEDTVGTLTTLSKTQVNTSIAKVLKERSEETAFNLSNTSNIETIVNKIKTVHNIPDSDDFTNIKTNAKTYISTINTSINNVTGTFTQRITEATKIKIASSNKITTVKETFKTDSFDSSAVVSDVNTAKTEVTIQTIQAPTRSLISVPGAPTNLSITPGSYSASASWTAPSDTGGATISGYKLEYIELSRKVPSSPSGLTASVSVDDATLNWTASVDDGNSPILEYTVNYKADAVSVYCYNHGYMGGEYLISGSSDDYSDATVLTNNTVVNVVSTDSGNRYTFNGETTYHENNSYKITGNGTYTFQNVPSEHPIAILNNGISNITYTGDSDKKSTKAVTGTTNDGTYDFYHGNVTVTVSGGANFSYYASNTAINTGSANTTHVITNLPMAVKYFFSVGGNNDIGVGTVTETSISYLAATFPGQPTNLSADIVKTSATSVLLTWSEPNDGGEPIDSYTAEYSLGPAYSSWVVFNPDPDSTPVDFNKEITGLQSGKLYKFRIRGVNAIGNGLYSDEVTGSPGRYAIEPVLPTMSSNGILTTYIHSSYFYRVYTFTTAYSSGYVLEAGGSGTENPNTLRPVNTTSDNVNGSTYSSGVLNNYSSDRVFNGTSSGDADCFHSINHNPVAPNDPAWIAIKFPGTTTKKITKYKIWARNDSQKWQPVDWEIRGVTTGVTYAGNSTSASNYTVLDTVTGETTWEQSNSNSVADNTECKEFEITTPGYYNTYVINITNSVWTNSNSNGNYTSIGQIAYYSSTSIGESFTLSGSVSQKFDIFMIGGGGSGGTTWAGGGGGAGSAVLAKNWSISPSTYEIMVGGGGAAITDTTAKGNDGSPTSFGSLFATKGGGGGGTGSSSLKIGNDGGSGGGSSNCVNYVLEAGGIDGLRGTGGAQGVATSEGETSIGSWTGGPTSVFNGTLNNDTDGVHTDGGIFSNGNSGNNIFHIMFEFPTSTTITKYKIWGRGASSFYSPKSWQLRGATSSSAYNNGSGTYDVLDIQTDVADIGQSSNTSITNDTNRGEYFVSSPGSYTTYVLDIGSSYNSNHCFIGEIAYYSTTSGSNYDGGASKFETASATIDLDSASATKYYKNDPTTYNLSSSQNVTIYGNDGGSSVSSSGSSQDFGAGGGGIGAAGSNATTSSGGAGGAGLANDYRYGPASGTTDLKQDGSVLSHPGIQYYGGGGGGGGDTNTATQGGSNVGGTGVKNATAAGDAVANTGSGGGGGIYSGTDSGSGSTGIVTVRQLLGVVGVPFSPTNVSGTAANAQSVVSWTVPSWDGNYAITGYKVEYAAGSSYSSWTVAVASTSSSPYTVTGLTNGTNYKFRVSAINSQGTGAASTPSSAVSPNAFSATGGTITTYTSSGVNYKVHTFLTSGTFTITGSKAMDFLIVAGGGAGGPGANQGYEAPGGGAGGLIYKTGQTISANNYSVIIGAGGDKSGNSSGGQGNDSSFNGNIAKGGGHGAWLGASSQTADNTGADGGSGGGGRHNKGVGGQAVANSGDTVTENSTTANEVGVFGNKGGDNDHDNQSANNWGGGGGGAGSRGKHSNETTTSVRSDGGIGKEYNIRNGTGVYYAGGGGGGGSQGSHGQGGIGGGGNAATGYQNTGAGYDGVANTGGGGGGAYSWDSSHKGGNGGSGIVVIRYVV